MPGGRFNPGSGQWNFMAAGLLERTFKRWGIGLPGTWYLSRPERWRYRHSVELTGAVVWPLCSNHPPDNNARPRCGETHRFPVGLIRVPTLNSGILLWPALYQGLVDGAVPLIGILIVIDTGVGYVN